MIVHGGHLSRATTWPSGSTTGASASNGTELQVPLLIENTAGGDHAMARHLDRIAQLWEAVAGVGSDQVGFCLDTCHAHAGGEQLIGLVERLMAITGRIDLVHANDSRDGFDSGADRHANLGGRDRADALVEVVRSAGAPVVVETPGGREGQAPTSPGCATASQTDPSARGGRTAALRRTG